MTQENKCIKLLWQQYVGWNLYIQNFYVSKIIIILANQDIMQILFNLKSLVMFSLIIKDFLFSVCKCLRLLPAVVCLYFQGKIVISLIQT